MFKCKCNCDFSRRLTEIDIKSLNERIGNFCNLNNLTARTNAEIVKTLRALIDYLGIEVIPEHQKEKIPEVQFRKRKQVKQEK